MSMKKTEYKIEIVRGHILVNDDLGSKVLIDTGAPTSYVMSPLTDGAWWHLRDPYI